MDIFSLSLPCIFKGLYNKYPLSCRKKNFIWKQRIIKVIVLVVLFLLLFILFCFAFVNVT